MNKTIMIISALAVFGCDSASNKTMAPIADQKTQKDDVQISSQQQKFIPDRVASVVIEISSLQQSDIEKMSREQKLSFVMKAFKAFERMEIEDYYRYSPDQMGDTSITRGYTKDQANAYAKRMRELMDGALPGMTPEEKLKLQKMQEKIPYLADLEKQKKSNMIFDMFSDVIKSIHAFQDESGQYPSGISDLKNIDEKAIADTGLVQEWSVQANGVVEIKYSKVIYDGAIMTFVPFKTKSVNNETGETKLNTEWKCMISPPQAMKYRPDKCLE